MGRQIRFFTGKLYRSNYNFKCLCLSLAQVFLLGLQLSQEGDGDCVQRWKNAPNLDLEQKGTHDFTFIRGLSVTVSKYFTTSFWLIKAILTHGNADNW